MKTKPIIKGALVLIICSLIGKVLGAVYRIPLARILGGVGMGQYQLTFPLYCLILTVSTSGIPVAISKLVAEFKAQKRFYDSKRLLWLSVFILTIISLLGAGLIVLGAKTISAFQGNPSVYVCYYGIAPAIVFVGVLSAFRGYFQGNLIMFPTAISGLVEQIFKMIFGLALAVKFSVYGTEYAVLGALVGVSISEFVAFVFLFVCYLCHLKKNKVVSSLPKSSFKFLARQLASLAVPITLGGLISPLSSMVDSLFAVNLLMSSGFSNSAATMMLGIQSGVVEPLVNLPVVISVSLGTVLLPNLSALCAEKNEEKIKQMIEKSYQISLSISIVCAICYVIFGSQILSFLYGGSFSSYELFLAEKLLMLASLNIMFLSIVQVSSSVLQGLGHSKYTVKTLFVGCVIKVAINFVLLQIPSINIMGAVISGGVCYFVIMMLNYVKVKKLTGVSIKNSYFYVSIQACFVSLFAYFSNTLFQMVFNGMMSMICAGLIAVFVFAITYYVFFMRKNEKSEFKQKNQLT
jgi:stage V sporulation protein B